MNVGRQDTMVSCDPDRYSGIYDVSKRLEVKQTTSSTFTQDTLSKSPANEALQRLERPSENTILQPNHLFRRIGKYVFLSVAMPPYFLLYGLPKWLLIESFQILSLSFSWLTQKINQKSQKPLQFIITLTNRALFALQQLTKRLIEPVAKFGVQVGLLFQNFAAKLYQISQAPYRAFSKTVKNSLNALNFFKELPAKIGHEISLKLNQLKEKSLNFIEMVSLKFSDNVERIKEWPAIFLGWGSQPLQFLNQTTFNFRKKLKDKFFTSSSAAWKCTEWLGYNLSLLSLTVKNIMSPIPVWAKKLFSPWMKKVSKVCKSGVNACKEFLGKRKNKFVALVDRLKEKLKKLTPDDVIEAILPASLLAKIPDLLKKWILKIKNSQTLHVFFKGLLVSVISILSGSSALVKKSVTNSSKLKESLKLSFQKVATLYQKVKGKLKQSLEFLQVASKKSCHGLLVGVFMVAILFGWGVISLKELTARWLGKFSLIHSK